MLIERKIPGKKVILMMVYELSSTMEDQDGKFLFDTALRVSWFQRRTKKNDEEDRTLSCSRTNDTPA